jgi:hypothetical protein
MIIGLKPSSNSHPVLENSIIALLTTETIKYLPLMLSKRTIPLQGRNMGDFRKAQLPQGTVYAYLVA